MSTYQFIPGHTEIFLWISEIMDDEIVHGIHRRRITDIKEYWFRIIYLLNPSGENLSMSIDLEFNLDEKVGTIRFCLRNLPELCENLPLQCFYQLLDYLKKYFGPESYREIEKYKKFLDDYSR